MSSDNRQKTLTDEQIVTDRPEGRRGFMGLMAAAGVAGAVGSLAPSETQAQALTDSDNGTWTDTGGCGRGSGGVYTGISDADDGSTGTDLGGHGRGAPFC